MDLCYKCCESKHLSRNCKVTIKCDLCGSSRHATALHPDQPTLCSKPGDGGERVKTKLTDTREKVNLGASNGSRDNVQGIDEVPYPIFVHNFVN